MAEEDKKEAEKQGERYTPAETMKMYETGQFAYLAETDFGEVFRDIGPEGMVNFYSQFQLGPMSLLEHEPIAVMISRAQRGIRDETYISAIKSVSNVYSDAFNNAKVTDVLERAEARGHQTDAQFRKFVEGYKDKTMRDLSEMSKKNETAAAVYTGLVKLVEDAKFSGSIHNQLVHERAIRAEAEIAKKYAPATEDNTIKLRPRQQPRQQYRRAV